MKQNLRLLIVDDDARILELASLAARPAFEAVMTADDGATALEWLSHCPENELPDAILTDLNMPHIDGVELARQLYEHPRWREIPLAMFSSTASPEEHPSALGCRAFFLKPIGLAALTQMMASIAELAETGSAVPH